MTSNPELPDRRQILKDALVKIDKLQSKLDAVEKAKNEPIAIIGMGCRFPGGVTNPESYWELLRNGVDAISEVPAERESLKDYDATESDIPSTWYGGFLDRIDTFDPHFFGISPREALSLDPQQRLTLEVAWEALENAGQAPDQLAGSQTGIFMGVSTNDYAQLLRVGGSSQLDVYSATGSALNAIPGRVAYTLGFNGPSVAIDTACSSSLVAIHLACQSLRSGESDLALAGGVNVILMPEAYVCFTRWGMMAADGRCKTFDSRADGFVRSEGCGILTLKRLSDAVADNDRILAVIRGSAVNQDGRSSGLTVPNGPAQQAVIRTALTNAKVQPNEVSYVETHGTGTLIGDPIEVEALGVVLGAGRPKDQALTIGAVKTNIGHAESASGVAGVIKVILSLQHGEIPRNLHFSEPNSRIPWPDFPMVIPTEHTAWEPVNGKRIAGISGFGFSGTNAHVVLEAAPIPEPVEAALERPAHIMTLSARSEVALKELTKRYSDYLADHTELAAADIGFTTNTGRAQFTHRLAVAGTSSEEMRQKLLSVLSGESGKLTTAMSRPKVAFLFTGQGAHYLDMGRVLYQTQPIYREAFDRCAAVFSQYLDQSLASVTFSDQGADGSVLASRAYVQPSLFALQYALASLWLSWGVKPTLVAGHSLGEYAAACIAGVFSLEDAVKLVAARSRLMSELPEAGEMVAVFADEATVTAAVLPYIDQVSAAVINGAQNVVISGTASGVAAVLETLTAQGIKSRKLNVAQAFHSPLIDPMLDAFEAVAASITYHAPTIKLVSSMTGQLASASELGSAHYWREHIRQPVRFADAVATLDAQGAQVYIEIGPRPTLIGLAQQALPDNQAVWLPSIRESKDDWEQILDGLGKAYTAGVNVDWAGFDKPYVRHKVTAPTYPFQRDRYWTEASAPLIKLGASRYSNAGHPLLGTRLALANVSGVYVWENEITLQRLPYLDDHRVEGLAIVPATAYMEMGMAAAVETVGDLPLLITEVENLKPLFIREDDAYVMQVTLEANTDQSWAFAVFSHPSSQTGEVTWTKHVEGKINRAAASTSSEVFDPQALIKGFSAEISGETFYQQLRAKGNQWGETFQGIERLWVGEREALSFVRVPQPLETDINRYVLHPAVADACGHVLTSTIPTEKGGAFVGGGVDETRVYQRLSGSGLWCYARLQPDDPNGDSNVLTGDVKVFDENGTLLSETLGVHLWHVDQAPASTAPQYIQDWFYAVDWQVQDAVPTPIEAGRWLVVGDTGGVGDAVAQHMQSLGSQAVVVYANDHASLTDAFSAAADWKGVIHLSSLDAGLAEELSASALNDSITANAASILDTIRAIKDFRHAQPVRLWLVTRGAQSIAGEAVAVAQSAVWGLGKTITLEHGELWGGLIDIDPNASTEASAQQVWQAICATTKGDDQQAIRDGQRYAARLVRRDLTSASASAFVCHEDGSYLITGGLGGLGLTAARWLADHGAKHVILMGRTALPPRAQWPDLDPNGRSTAQVNAIQALEAMGVSVDLAAVDVGDESQLRAYLESYQSPIRGVIHAAGVMQNQAMLDQPIDEMKRIFQPKIDGGWLLHTLLKDAPLDFFVMYSSAATLLSSPLNSSYAAANAFLNGLAHYRHALGQPALSINWGMWGEVGMAVNAGISSDAANALMHPMDVRGALAALEQALNLGQAQIAIMAVTPKSWERIYATLYKPPFLSQLMSAEQTAADVSAQNAFNLQTLREADPDDRSDLLESFLAQQVSHVLGFGSRALDTDESLFDLGIDSLMAVELKNRIEAHLSMAIPMMQLLQGPSVIDLTEIILDQLGPNLEMVAAPGPVNDSYEEGML